MGEAVYGARAMRVDLNAVERCSRCTIGHAAIVPPVGSPTAMDRRRRLMQSRVGRASETDAAHRFRDEARIDVSSRTNRGSSTREATTDRAYDRLCEMVVEKPGAYSVTGLPRGIGVCVRLRARPSRPSSGRCAQIRFMCMARLAAGIGT